MKEEDACRKGDPDLNSGWDDNFSYKFIYNLVF